MLSRLRYQHIDINDTFNLLPVRLVIIETMFYSIWLKDIKTTKYSFFVSNTSVEDCPHLKEDISDTIVL